MHAAQRAPAPPIKCTPWAVQVAKLAVSTSAACPARPQHRYPYCSLLHAAARHAFCLLPCLSQARAARRALAYHTQGRGWQQSPLCASGLLTSSCAAARCTQTWCQKPALTLACPTTSQSHHALMHMACTEMDMALALCPLNVPCTRRNMFQGLMIAVASSVRWPPSREPMPACTAPFHPGACKSKKVYAVCADLSRQAHAGTRRQSQCWPLWHALMPAYTASPQTQRRRAPSPRACSVPAHASTRRQTQCVLNA